MVSRRLYFALVTVCRLQLARQDTARTGLAPIDGALSGFVMPKPKPEPKPELAPLLLLLRLGLRVEGREGSAGVRVPLVTVLCRSERSPSLKCLRDGCHLQHRPSPPKKGTSSFTSLYLVSFLIILHSALLSRRGCNHLAGP